MSEALARLTFAEVRFERAPCPLCGGDVPSAPVLEGRDDTWQKEGTFTIVTCGACGLAYTSPRPTSDTMRYYYEDCYAGRSQEEMRKAALESPWSRFISAARLKTLERARALRPGDAVLDVGCSYGAFIEHARVTRQIEASAIDLDAETMAYFVNPTDIRVYTGDLREVAFPDASFDVVTLFETLEHVYDPVALLREVRRILKPGGVVSVEVPNWDAPTRRLFGSCWLPLLLPTHLQHFGVAQLKRCAVEAGLEPVHHQTMFFPTEFTLSLWALLSRVLGRPPQEQKRWPRKVLEACVGLFLVGVFFLIDLPVIGLLHLMGRAGHQTMVARTPPGP